MIIIQSFFMAEEFLVGQGLLIIDASRSHSYTTLGRLLWTSDQPDAEANKYTMLYGNLSDIRISIYLDLRVFRCCICCCFSVASRHICLFTGSSVVRFFRLINLSHFLSCRPLLFLHSDDHRSIFA